MIQFDVHIFFQIWLVQPPTRFRMFVSSISPELCGLCLILRYHRPVVPRAVARSSSTTSCQECWKDSVDTPLKFNMVHHENRPKPKRKFYLSGIIFRGKLLNLRGGRVHVFGWSWSHFFSGQEEQFSDVFFWREASLKQWNQRHLRVDFIHIPGPEKPSIFFF